MEDVPMTRFTGMRLAIAGAGLFAAGMAVKAPLMAPPAPSHASVHAGDTVAGFMPDEVMSLTYTTSWGRTTAQRSGAGAAFQILSTFALGRPAQHCTASPQMAGHLAGFPVLTARRELSPRQREQEFPMLLGVLDIRDSSTSDPPEPVQVFANGPRTAVAVVVNGQAAEVTLPAAEPQWFETACEEAASDRPAQKKVVTFLPGANGAHTAAAGHDRTRQPKETAPARFPTTVCWPSRPSRTSGLVNATVCAT
jgi:hypothetical protein